MTNDKFVDNFISFVKDNFNFCNHHFIIIGNPEGTEFEKSIIQSKKITRIQQLDFTNIDNVIKFIKHIYDVKYDKIHLHGLFNYYLIRLLFLQPWLLNKCNWIIWGADLYKYNQNNNTFNSKKYEFMRKQVIKNINEITSYIPGDYEVAKKIYNTNASYNHAIPYNISGKHRFFEELKIKSTDSENIIFQVGNSADPSNNHIEILKILSKFKEKKIKILVPLSYGDSKHRKKVIKYGKKIFGKKFIPLTNFYPPKKYFKIMSNVDIGIFNHKRQQGLGNINALLQLEKKVYIRSDTTIWDYFQEIGINTHDTKILKNESFNQIINYDKFKAEKNSEIMRKTRSEENRVLMWKKIFEDCK